MKNTLTALIMLALLESQCRGKDDFLLIPVDYLPPFTQTGEYTFGCLVNGAPQVSRTTTDVRATYFPESTLRISADMDTDPGEQSISLRILTDIEVGRNYDLTDDAVGSVVFDAYGADLSTCRYEEDNTLSGTLTLTYFDDSDRIVSGTFEFTTITDGCDTIRVTDGRFDIPYR